MKTVKTGSLVYAMIVALVLAFQGFPHAYIMSRFYGAPYVLLLVLIGIGLFNYWPKISEVVVVKWQWSVAIAALLFGIFITQWITVSPERLVVGLGEHIALPFIFLLLGMILYFSVGRYSVMALMPWALVAVSVAFMVIKFSPTGTVFSHGMGMFVESGNRIWFSQFAGDAVGATRLNTDCFPAALMLLVAIGFREWFVRLPALLCFGGFAWVAVTTETRGVAGASLLFGVVLFLGMLNPRDALRAGVGLAVAAVVAAVILINVELPDRFRVGYQQDRGLTGRTEMWLSKISEVADHPIGLGSEQALMEGVSSHNQLIEMLHVYGWFAGAALLVIMLLFTFELLKAFRSWNAPPFKKCLLCCYGAIALHSMTDAHMTASKQTYLLGFFLLGLILAESVFGVKRKPNPMPPHKLPRRNGGFVSLQVPVSSKCLFSVA